MISATEEDELSRTIAKGLAPVLQKAVQDAVMGLALRVAALENRPEVKYAGTHVPSEVYSAGSLVTRAGSLWLAIARTKETPGTCADWRLVVKRGTAGAAVLGSSLDGGSDDA
jgi:hypothetical protein